MSMPPEAEPQITYRPSETQMRPPPQSTRLRTAELNLLLGCLRLLQYLQRVVVVRLHALPLMGFKAVRLERYTELVQLMEQTWQAPPPEGRPSVEPSERPALLPERRHLLSKPRLSHYTAVRRTLRQWPPRRHWRRPGLAGAQ